MELCITIECLLGNKNCGTALQIDENTKTTDQSYWIGEFANGGCGHICTVVMRGRIPIPIKVSINPMPLENTPIP
jgi:hypothetical protein